MDEQDPKQRPRISLAAIQEEIDAQLARARNGTLSALWNALFGEPAGLDARPSHDAINKWAAKCTRELMQIVREDGYEAAERRWVEQWREWYFELAWAKPYTTVLPGAAEALAEEQTRGGRAYTENEARAFLIGYEFEHGILPTLSGPPWLRSEARPRPPQA